MPELPEVETVRRGLERLVKGKEIEKVDERLDVLRGQKRACQDILNYVNKRIK